MKRGRRLRRGIWKEPGRGDILEEMYRRMGLLGFLTVGLVVGTWLVQRQVRVYPRAAGTQCETEGGTCVPANATCTGGTESILACGEGYRCYFYGAYGSCVVPTPTLAQVCDPNKNYCAGYGNDAQTKLCKCNSTGTAATCDYCPTGYYCALEVEDCLPLPTPTPVCVPNSSVCKQESNLVTFTPCTCNSTGSGWNCGVSCADNELCMENPARCVPEPTAVPTPTPTPVCVPGRKECAVIAANPGGAVVQCNADGSGWFVVQSCEDGTYCDDATLSCKPLPTPTPKPVCQAGGGWCDQVGGQEAYCVCNSSGTGFSCSSCRVGEMCTIFSSPPGCRPMPTSTPLPTPTPVSLAPEADAHVRSDSTYKGTNFGTKTSLEVDGSPVKIIYVRFDLTGQAGRSVAQAKLRLKITNSSSSTQNVLRVGDVTWGEKTITYNNRPAVGTKVTSVAGGAAGSWIELDVTAAVKEKLGQKMSLGISSAGSDGLDSYSRESGVDKPQLVIR